MGLKATEAFGGDLAEEFKREEAEWRKRLESQDRFYFAVEENRVFISIAGAKNIGDKLWMLMAVRTHAGSKRQGIG